MTPRPEKKLFALVATFAPAIYFFAIFASKLNVFGWTAPIEATFAATFCCLGFGLKWLIGGVRRASWKYRLYLCALIVLLVIQALARGDGPVELVGLLTSASLFAVSGLLIPAAVTESRLINWLAWTLQALLLVSIAGFPVFPFEGGRYVGPMASSVALTELGIYGAAFFIAQYQGSRRVVDLVCAAGWLFLLLQAGSRSSILVVGAGAAISFIFGLRRLSLQGVVLWMLALFSAVTVLVANTETVSGIFDGRVSFGSREEVTDPVADRMLHWEYGKRRLEKSPLIGEGVLSKFKDESGVISQAAFTEDKDPHNLFFYAGQVGGYPLMALYIGGYACLWFRVLRVLVSADKERRVFASMLLPYMLLVLAGGSMLSLGSLVDRLAWILIGFILIKPRSKTYASANGAVVLDNHHHAQRHLRP